MMTSLRTGAILLALLAVSSCGGDHAPTEPSGPVPGVLNVALTTPNADDGALLLTISGAPVVSVEAASAAYQVYSFIPDTNNVRVLVSGDLATGALLRIHVADTRRAASYHATISQAASRTTFAQRTLSGYSVAVAP